MLRCLVLALLVVPACARPAGAPTPDPRAIASARAAVEAPLTDLGEAVRTAAARITEVRLGDPAGPQERRDAATTIAAEDLARVDTRREAVVGAEPLSGEEPELAAARAALDAAVAAAADLVAAGEGDLAHVVRLADADATLEALVAVWDEPGARSTQLERLTAARDGAAELAADLAGAAERPDCSQALQRRAAAARAVAAATGELRDLVAAHQGEAFDRRRGELAADPYGTATRTLAELDAAEAVCWSEQGAAVAAAERFDGAVDALVAALNPASLGAARGGDGEARERRTALPPARAGRDR